MSSTAPKCGTGTSWPSTGLEWRPRRHRRVEMGDDLVAEEVEVDPFAARSVPRGSRAARRRRRGPASRSWTGKARWKGGRAMGSCHRSCDAMSAMWIVKSGAFDNDGAREAPRPLLPRRTRRRLRLPAARPVAADAGRLRAAALARRARAPSLRSALARGWWFGVGHFVARPELDRHRLHLPGGDAGLARLGRGGPALALPRRLSGRRRRPRLALGAAGASLRLVLLFAAAWIVTEWLRATLFTGFAWNPLGVGLVATPVGRLGAAGRHLRPVGDRGPDRRRCVLLLGAQAWPAGGRRGGAGRARRRRGLARRRRAAPRPTGPALRIVQPNIGQQDKWREGFEERESRRGSRACSRGERAGRRACCSGPRRR